MPSPTVTKEDVEKAIVGETYTVLPDGRTTICQLTMTNGFTVDGKSACVSIEIFNKALGEKYSREQAVEKVWSYLGYDLSTKVNMLKGAGEPTGMILKVGVPTTYVGTKVVRAIAMNRKAYNDLRGWEMPSKEDPHEDGMLYEQVDGSIPNVPGFAGYISWMPRDVFDRTYTLGLNPEPGNFVDRLRVEYDQLNDRVNRLTSFIGSEKFNALSTYDQTDLHAQLMAMRSYMSVLNRRVMRLL